MAPTGAPRVVRGADRRGVAGRAVVPNGSPAARTSRPSIVRDAAYRAFIAPGRRLSASEVSVDPRTLEDTPFTTVLSPCEELALLLGDARAAGVPSHDLDLVRDLARAGSPGTVAAERAVTVRTIRNHRDRATARLRRIALAA